MPPYAYPLRKRRSESFLGVHFDFHAGDDNHEIGKYTTPQMIETILQKVQPDYVQCDCKGHAGFSSYPTKVGYPAPGIVADALRTWRQVTAEHGVGLFMHYSGVWDNQAVLHHPEWARIDENGEPDRRLTSVFGPYADELLIPQLLELAIEYGVDGAWVDGECWATRSDYAPAILAQFASETGIEQVGRKPGEPGFLEFSDFCREGFLRYLRHYVDAVHAKAPSFQIASNWAFSSMIPEPVSANVDYLSGDYTLQDSVNSARLEGRCLARQGTPWDLMAWAFSHKIDWVNQANSDRAPCTKGAVQLMQEAAVVLALGGGFQAYFTQKRDGSVRTWQMDIMAEVARFCRARQPFCHKQELLPQVGLIYAKEAIYRLSPPVLFQPGDLLLPLRGILQMLLDSQQVVEIVSEHHLHGRMAEYPLLVLPEWGTLEPGFRQELLDYVHNGGSLLVVGPQAAALFEKELGVRFSSELEPEATSWLEHEGKLAGLSRNPLRAVELLPGAQPLGKFYRDNDVTGPSQIAASITPYGKGKIAGVYANLGERYVHGTNYVARRFLADLVRRMFPQPLVEVHGSHSVDVSLGKQGEALLINLVNTSGPHGDPEVYTFDEIPALGPLSITVRLPQAPQHVTLQPGNSDLAFSYQDGLLQILLPRLEIYEILEIC
jgi:hypothetical protein